MKTIKLSFMALALMLMAFAPARVGPEMKKNAISWKTTEINLGEIPQDKPVNIKFAFQNTGDTPIVITSVQASCGCTSTDFTKTPVKPGESTTITATFNAAKKGAFTKTVTVITSAEENPRTLT